MRRCPCRTRVRVRRHRDAARRAARLLDARSAGRAARDPPLVARRGVRRTRVTHCPLAVPRCRDDGLHPAGASRAGGAHWRHPEPRRRARLPGRTPRPGAGRARCVARRAASHPRGRAPSRTRCIPLPARARAPAAGGRAGDRPVRSLRRAAAGSSARSLTDASRPSGGPPTERSLPMRRYACALTALFALGLVLSACGGSESASDTESETTTTIATEATTTVVTTTAVTTTHAMTTATAPQRTEITIRVVDGKPDGGIVRPSV